MHLSREKLLQKVSRRPFFLDDLDGNLQQKENLFFAKKVGGAEFAAILTIQFSRGLHAALTLAYVPEPSVFPRVYCSSSGFPRLSTGTRDRCSDSREPRESKLCEEVIAPHFVPLVAAVGAAYGLKTARQRCT